MGACGRGHWCLCDSEEEISNTKQNRVTKRGNMLGIVMITLLGSSLSTALVVHGKINGSAINFLPCDPKVSKCDDAKENLIGCDVDKCKTRRCPDGSSAPIPLGNCCPDTSLCPATNCAAIGCLVELCPNGEMPPVPAGRCCPSALLCPREDCPATCPQATCPDGRVAPTPAGKCCPDVYLCDQERECASKEQFCEPEFCPNGDLAPVPEGGCCPSKDLCPLQHCQGISCPPKKCPTGDIAPIPRDSCCPSKAECDNKNCSQVRCIVERCDDGSIAPVPEGQCCPSKRACPAQAFSLEPSYSRGTDCTKVTCYLARCPGSNLVAPVPWGNCCPNIGLCPLTTRVLEDGNESSPTFHQQSIESF